MKSFYKYFFIFFLSITTHSQNIWEFSENKNKITIPFQLINNTIVVQPKLNNISLNLIIDTGSAYNILFGFPAKDSIAFYNTYKIKITGPGMLEPKDAYISKNNKLEFKNLSSKNLDIVLMLEEEYNFSTNMGIPIHGIIGADFFRDNKVEILYTTKKIIVHRKENNSYKRKISKYEKLPFILKEKKPYIPVEINIDTKKLENLELLIDTGMSDGVWIFEREIGANNNPYINDFLGSSIGGNIYGKRVRFKKVKFSNFEFSEPIISLPDSTSFVKTNLLNTRDGSFGGDLLKRFNIIFDYSNQTMYLKKNGNYLEKFHYNIAGIDLHHNGIEIIEEKDNKASFNTVSFVNGSKPDISAYNVRYVVKPGIEIAYIRKNSIADRAGLKVDDKIVAINGKKAIHYNLNEITSLFYKNIDETIVIEIERAGKKAIYELLLEEEI